MLSLAQLSPSLFVYIFTCIPAYLHYCILHNCIIAHCIHGYFQLHKPLNNLEFDRQTNFLTHRHLALFKSGQVWTGWDRSGQGGTGRDRLGKFGTDQDWSGQVSHHRYKNEKPLQKFGLIVISLGEISKTF